MCPFLICLGHSVSTAIEDWLIQLSCWQEKAWFGGQGLAKKEVKSGSFLQGLPGRTEATAPNSSFSAAARLCPHSTLPACQQSNLLGLLTWLPETLCSNSSPVQINPFSHIRVGQLDLSIIKLCGREPIYFYKGVHVSFSAMEIMLVPTGNEWST